MVSFIPGTETEQLNGKEYASTIDFLNKNDYNIVEFTIDTDKIGGTWEKWIDNNEDTLTKRATEVCDVFRKYVLEIIK